MKTSYHLKSFKIKNSDWYNQLRNHVLTVLE